MNTMTTRQLVMAFDWTQQFSEVEMTEQARAFGRALVQAPDAVIDECWRGLTKRQALGVILALQEQAA